MSAILTSVMHHGSTEQDDPQIPKIWYYQDRYQENPKKEVELEMDNNVSYSRIHMKPDFSLVINNFSLIDVGIYRCHGKDGQEAEKKYNYRIEPILKDIGGEFIEEGNITEWEKYRDIYLLPITMQFAISKMTDLISIREEGVTLQVISEWAPWSPCKQCVFRRGIRTSRGYCRLKRTVNWTMVERNDTIVIRFFRKSPMLPCKMTMESKVVWKKDALTLKKGIDWSPDTDEEARVLVDTFSTLYLKDVSENEEGNYTCYVDDVNMMRMKVIVISKARLLSKAFLRHLGYLAFPIFLTSFCYGAGIVMAYRRRDKFQPLPQDDAEEEDISHF
ncbi:hypothetical protein HN011_012101 [Eciton burchellii]|nr:hypothetical protein HN011_012101 [Eciton burchellii]